MNIVKGKFHKRSGLDYAIILVQVAICAVVIGAMAYYAASGVGDHGAPAVHPHLGARL